MAKKLPKAAPGEAASPVAAAALRASLPVALIQYPSPASTVTTELQRNHHSARDISAGNTLLFVGASSSFRNGTFTRLKKYNKPTQAMPATKCTQRKNIRLLVGMSEGGRKGRTNPDRTSPGTAKAAVMKGLSIELGPQRRRIPFGAVQRALLAANCTKKKTQES